MVHHYYIFMISRSNFNFLLDLFTNFHLGIFWLYCKFYLRLLFCFLLLFLLFRLSFLCFLLLLLVFLLLFNGFSIFNFFFCFIFFALSRPLWLLRVLIDLFLTIKDLRFPLAFYFARWFCYNLFLYLW